MSGELSEYASASVGRTTFSWLLIDEDQRRIGLRLSSTPEEGRHLGGDMAVLVDMLTEAGLEPAFEAQNMRLNKNGTPSVTVTWLGAVNNLTVAQQVLGRMTEIWKRA